MKMDQNIEAFFALIRGGLWEQDVQLSHLECIDFKEILRIAEEQSVVGLVAAGIEHIIDIKVPKEDVLQFVGSALQIEQQNTALNSFIADLIRKLREEDIYTLLVKGQGIGGYQVMWIYFLVMTTMKKQKKSCYLIHLITNKKGIIRKSWDLIWVLGLLSFIVLLEQGCHQELIQ